MAFGTLGRFVSGPGFSPPNSHPGSDSFCAGGPFAEARARLLPLVAPGSLYASQSHLVDDAPLCESLLLPPSRRREHGLRPSAPFTIHLVSPSFPSSPLSRQSLQRASLGEAGTVDDALARLPVRGGEDRMALTPNFRKVASPLEEIDERAEQPVLAPEESAVASSAELAASVLAAPTPATGGDKLGVGALPRGG